MVSSLVWFEVFECFEAIYLNLGNHLVVGPFRRSAAAYWKYIIVRQGTRYQGDREGRPYYITKRLAKPVYGRGDPRGRPGQRTLNANT